MFYLFLIDWLIEIFRNKALEGRTGVRWRCFRYIIIEHHIRVQIWQRYSFIHLFIHPFIHPYIHLFIYSIILSFVLPFIHSFIHSSIYPFIHLFILSSFHSLVHIFIRPWIELTGCCIFMKITPSFDKNVHRSSEGK